MALQNFPGVYVKIIDNSQFTATQSRFICGLIGVAENGPFDKIIQITSLQNAQQQLGSSVAGQYLMPAIQLISDFSDSVYVVRVGNQYKTVDSGDVTANSGAYVINTQKAALVNPGDYVRVSQPGLATTVNARVQAVDTVGYTVTLVSTGLQAVPLAATYTAATLDHSPLADAANEAEAFMLSPVWSSSLSALGTLQGNKNDYQINCSMDPTGVVLPGDTLLITQTGFATTSEIMVKSTQPPVPGQQGVIFFEPTNRSDIGYQNVALQDSYTIATAQTLVGYQQGLHVLAATAGTWANSTSANSGLVLQVQPGSTPNTKAISVYQDGGLLEVIDNLSTDSNSPNYYETYINGNDHYIVVKVIANGTFTGVANTRNPWNTITYPTINIVGATGGFNGEGAQAADYIGTIDPATGNASGLKLYDNPGDGLNIAILAAPGVSDINVAQELIRINTDINAFSPFDIPDNLNLRQAIDFHNGAGLYTGQGKLNDYHAGYFFNWFSITDATNGQTVFVPPSCGYLRCAAYTFNAAKPWYAAAGDLFGLIPEAATVRYPTLNNGDLQLTIGNGNALNVIMLRNGNIELYGDLTSQRNNTVLQEIHAVILVNATVNTLTALSQKYIFAPIDSFLLTSISNDFNGYLASLKNDRGLENYLVECDNGNNSAVDRQNRTVNVNYWIIPLNALYKLNVTCTVQASGSTLAVVTSTPITAG